jgi:hypothetical protein
MGETIFGLAFLAMMFVPVAIGAVLEIRKTQK